MPPDTDTLTPEQIVGPPTAPGISDEAELLTKFVELQTAVLAEVRGLRADIQTLADRVPTFRIPGLGRR